ncbi:MAG: sugar phosphate isomerase/epimerase [Deltaproteobacteria bacterium]|nr:sugar phosphate isomerase/epimerase [Deltaproteobacteria bacterium]
MRPELLGAHVPWAQIHQHLDSILDLGLIPEIAFKGPDLDTLDLQRLETVAKTLKNVPRRPTIHAPFFDLNPGAIDPLIQQATRQRLMQTLDAAEVLGAHLVVVHPGFDRWRYPGLEEAWINQAQMFFPPLLKTAEKIDCRLALENIYEETSSSLVLLVNALDSPWFGHCFDAGHWFLFGREPMVDWLTKISSKLFHLHLHDNHGTSDDHHPLGEGLVDFELLFTHVLSLPHKPSMTLEAHSSEDLIRSLEALKALWPE